MVVEAYYMGAFIILIISFIIVSSQLFASEGSNMALNPRLR